MRYKSRLTITLPGDILKKVDATIDGLHIRNRSHAIESLIRQSLKNPIETAVILTGGDKHTENPGLKTIDGQSLILITLRQLAAAHITNVIIVTGKDHQAIKEEVGTGKQLGLNIKFLNETKPSGTAGALKKAEKYITDPDFLVLHGDVIANLNFESFFNFHLSEGSPATIVVMPKKGDKSFGKVLIEGNQIKEFFEKTETKGIDIINTGIYLFKKSALAQINSRHSHLEKDVFPILARQNQLAAFIFQGLWHDISSPSGYKLAKSNYAKLKTIKQ